MRLEEVFKSSEPISSNQIENGVIFCLNEIIERKRIYKKTLAFALGGISLVAIIPILVNLYGAIQQSGFLEYLSAFFSAPIISFSKPEMSVVLAESLPIIPVALLLIITMTFFGAVRFGGDAMLIKKIRPIKQ